MSLNSNFLFYHVNASVNNSMQHFQSPKRFSPPLWRKMLAKSFWLMNFEPNEQKNKALINARQPTYERMAGGLATNCLHPTEEAENHQHLVETKSDDEFTAEHNGKRWTDRSVVIILIKSFHHVPIASFVCALDRIVSVWRSRRMCVYGRSKWPKRVTRCRRTERMHSENSENISLENNS